MRWMKHMTNARDNETLSELMECFGAEGYGVWWIILELIASQMDKSDKCHARYSLKKWARSCHVSVKKFTKIAEFLSKHEQFSVKKCDKTDDFLIIECPKLLKFRDEYSRKSGQTHDKVRKKSGATPEQKQNRTEQEEKQEQEPSSSEEEFYLTKKKRKLKGKRLETFLMFWEAFDYKKSKADAADSWYEIPQLTDKLVDAICLAAKKEASNRQSVINKGLTPIFPQGWLSSRRWEDEASSKKTATKSATLTAMPGAISV